MWVKSPEEASHLDHVLASHALNRDALRTHVALYRAVMFGRSELSRAEREAMAVCVSAANDCHY